MNMLIIGNGFDLAHGLPTKYTDFLKWVQDMKKIGERLVWVDEIPGNMKGAAEWLEDRSQPKEWIIKYNDKSIESYLSQDSDWRTKILAIDKHTKKYENWFIEHGLRFPPTADMDDEIRSAIEADKINKRIIKDNALESILKVIQEIEEESDKKIDDKVEEFLKIQSDKISEFEKAVPDQLKPLDVHAKLNYLCKKIFYLMKDNFWLLYFKPKDNGTWIDFEKEISKVIQKCDRSILSTGAASTELKDVEAILGKIGVSAYDYRVVVDRLEDDLNRLIWLFEIYLYEYVDNKKLPEKLRDITELKVSRVISFNYTHTFERLYGKDSLKDIQIDYIHGKADARRSMEDNNMVLGIDDFPSKAKEDVDINFIYFKKYYQRIYKNTDCTYMNWIAKIGESGKKIKKRFEKEYSGQVPFLKFRRREQHQIYIFGHSLDDTDKDVLRSLILNDNVKTTIFYRNKEQKRAQIANLDDVIGHEELVRRTSGVTKTIYFKYQYNQ